MFDALLAMTIVLPTLAAVTGTVAVVAFCAILTDAGIVMMAVGLALRLTTAPPGGAGIESEIVRFCVMASRMVSVCGVKPNAAATTTVALAGVYPRADPTTLLVPTANGVTITVVVADLAGTITDEGSEMMAGSKPVKVTT
jgi:hypothetical protein